MKWLVRRCAASTVVTPLSGFHHQPWPTWAMRWGSKTHTRSPVSLLRASLVRAHRSALLEVATTAPGASSTWGTATSLVLPERGAMNTTSTSSHDARSSGPPGRSRPRGSPAAAVASGLAVLTLARDGR